jgi:hypothetical protein
MAGKPYLHLASDRGREKRKRLEWRCAVCAKAGLPSGPMIRVILEADIADGKIEPTSERFACLACHGRGILTLI